MSLLQGMKINSRLGIFSFVAIWFCLVVLFTSLRAKERTRRPGKSWSIDSYPSEKAFVVASQRHEDTSWFEDHFPDWEKFIYVVDDPYAELTVARNKGRESMVYLSYIIDNYYRLPTNILFLHANRYQWHNDDPDYDGVPLLRNFRISYLRQRGYVNLRCVWTLGCPAELHPLADASGEAKEAPHAGHYYKEAFEELFPGQVVPEEVGASCCAQFAVTKEKVRERPRADYERIRNWLLDTTLDDSISGRIIEYSWHILFGQDPVYCPTAADCYCNTFGLCNVTCTSDDKCNGRYVLPPFSKLPNNWPTIGWDGERRTLGVPG